LLKENLEKDALKMSICDSGLKNKLFSSKITIEIKENHPLIKLSNLLSWSELYDLILPDLKSTTARLKWWLGRKLKVRIHLGIYLLQKLYNLTDRQMEYQLKDNAAFQLFCGRNSVKNWHVPDHTKIEEFRSRLSPDTQRQLSNHCTQQAVSLEFADPAHCDLDSTVQLANITYPSKAKLLTKLGGLAFKAAQHLKRVIQNSVDIMSHGLDDIDLKGIKAQAKAYFFNRKKLTPDQCREQLFRIWNSVQAPVLTVIEASCRLWKFQKEKLKWNEVRTIEQLQKYGPEYLKKIAKEIQTKQRCPDLKYSFHAHQVACIAKGKIRKPYEFGRVFQLMRLSGNFILAPPCDSLTMPDKESIKPCLEWHESLFGPNQIQSFATDKGYYSDANEQSLQQAGVSEIGLARPCNIKKTTLHPNDLIEKLSNRRAGIEPLIGHIKHQGQLGRSRMKSDRTTLSAGYASILGFNLRQLVRHQAGKMTRPSKPVEITA
jgi:transposase